MQFLTLSERRTAAFPESAFAEKREEEAQQARRLYLAGHIRQIWFRGDHPGACILWEAQSEEEVRGHLATLPFFAAGMVEVKTLVPLSPYVGFGPRD